MEKAKENEIKDSIDYKKLEREIKQFKWIASALVIVGLFAFAIGAGSVLMTGESKWAQSLGDFSGGVVASFWSLAGIMLVYIAFIGQKQQLMLQEEELRLTRDEMISTRMEIEGQRLEMEEQNKTAALQRFENTYFSLLSGVSNSISSLGSIDSNYSSFQVYSNIYGLFKSRYSDIRNSKNGLSEEQIVQQAYRRVMTEISGKNSGPDPFLVLDEVLLTIKFINYNVPKVGESYFYYELLFARLKDEIISLLLYKLFLAQDYKNLELMINCIDSSIKGKVSRFLIVDNHLDLFPKPGLKWESFS